MGCDITVFPKQKIKAHVKFYLKKIIAIQNLIKMIILQQKQPFDQTLYGKYVFLLLYLIQIKYQLDILYLTLLLKFNYTKWVCSIKWKQNTKTRFNKLSKYN